MNDIQSLFIYQWCTELVSGLHHGDTLRCLFYNFSWTFILIEQQAQNWKRTRSRKGWLQSPCWGGLRHYYPLKHIKPSSLIPYSNFIAVAAVASKFHADTATSRIGVRVRMRIRARVGIRIRVRANPKPKPRLKAWWESVQSALVLLRNSLLRSSFQETLERARQTLVDYGYIAFSRACYCFSPLGAVRYFLVHSVDYRTRRLWTAEATAVMR